MKISDLITIGNHKPLAIIGGINVIESEQSALSVAEEFCRATSNLDMPYIFKASFDKANRSSIDSYRGPGIEEGLRILEKIKSEFSVPVITDVHEIEQVKLVADIVDLIQLPAFLARQTDLIEAIANTDKPVNIKKPQFLSPSQVGHIVNKFRANGNERVIICERGSNFGYDNLVVDMLGIGHMKRNLENVPVILDVTHSLQNRNSNSAISGGRRQQFMDLALAGVAVSLSGVFIEAHPDPDSALCDGPSALPLDCLGSVLEQLHKVDECVKSLPTIRIK